MIALMVLKELGHSQNPFENLSFEEAKILGNLLEGAGIEVLPSATNLEKIHQRNPGMSVDLTTSATYGVDITMQATLDLIQEGVVPIPHAAARNIEDAKFEGLFTMFKDVGIKKFLAIAGDNKEPKGHLTSTMEMLEVMVSFGFIPEAIEVAGYPRKHSFISLKERDKALYDKQNFAIKHGINMSIKTQVCLDENYIVSFLEHLHNIDIRMPVTVGLLGPVNLIKANEHLKEVGVDDIEPVISRIRSGNLVEDLSILRYDPKDFLSKLVKKTRGEISGVCFYPLGNYNRTLDSKEEMQTLLKETF